MAATALLPSTWKRIHALLAGRGYQAAVERSAAGIESLADRLTDERHQP
jgi:hypothetical protein